MPANPKKLEEFCFKNRGALRRWLQRNHAQEESIWLIIHKKNSKGKSVSRTEAIEEGLCFGWIDSKANVLDEEKYKLLFSQRKPKSVWSKINKARIEQLMVQGVMAAPGLAKIEGAKKDCSWTTLDAIENFIMPEDLKIALSKNKLARKHFQAFPASAKKQIYHWIQSAKTSLTLEKRLLETVSLAEQNIRANRYIPKGK